MSRLCSSHPTASAVITNDNYFAILDPEPPRQKREDKDEDELAPVPPEMISSPHVPSIRHPAYAAFVPYELVEFDTQVCLNEINWDCSPDRLLEWDKSLFPLLCKQDILDRESVKYDICHRRWNCLTNEDVKRIAPAEEEEDDDEVAKHRCRKTVALECGHIFGRKCLTTWLRQNNSCPLCRKVVSLPIVTGAKQIRWGKQ